MISGTMVIDCHVHVSAFVEGNGKMSDQLLRSIPFRFMRWHFGFENSDASTERVLASKLIEMIGGATEMDAAVVLAFDAVYDPNGNRDWANTHLYVANDYVIGLARKHSRVLFGASIHPYRKDAVSELERCVKEGAVLLKWLPITQGINPADKRCIPFYEALAHYKLPLLSHTGGEKSLPSIDMTVADPTLLTEALKRGVTVIGAHCGTRSARGETDYVPQFVEMAEKYENFYGDTSALNLPTRWYAYKTILKNKNVLKKLVHGSDWPIISLPNPGLIGIRKTVESMRIRNWIQRDMWIKQQLGFDQDYWKRASKILRLPPCRN